MRLHPRDGDDRGRTTVPRTHGDRWQNIFLPLDMENTGFYEVDVVTANRSSGYTKEGIVEASYRRNNVYTLPARGSAAGGGYSTLDDMLKFGNGAAEGKIMVPDFREGTPPAPGLPFAIKGL